MDIMMKRQQRALTNLQREVQLEKEIQLEQEHKANMESHSSDDEETSLNTNKKRQREEEQQPVQDSLFPTCPFCHNHYELDLLERHQERCPKRPKPLKRPLLQSTILFPK
jgi:hypothetical protein